MIKRIIEIGSPASCSLNLNSLVIKQKTGESRVLLEDLGAVIVDHPAVNFTQKLLCTLTEYDVVVLFCNEKHLPQGILLSYTSHHLHSKIVKAQAFMKEPIKKRFWQSIIKAKIKEQANLLGMIGNERGRKNLLRYIPRVLSGDPENIEGVTSAIYFKEVFGKQFRRDRFATNENILLNYGYSIARSLTLRAISAAGLHPALGIFHKNQFNAFCLGDDLMEIIRPLIDKTILSLMNEGVKEINKETKPKILHFLLHRVRFDKAETSLLVGMQKFAQNLALNILGEKKRLMIPQILSFEV